MPRPENLGSLRYPSWLCNVVSYAVLCWHFYYSCWAIRRLIWAATRQNQQNECAPSEDSDKPWHPLSLIRGFAVRSMGSQGPKVSSCGQRRFWSDWADAQVDRSLRWAHTHFVGFVMSRLIYLLIVCLCVHSMCGNKRLLSFSVPVVGCDTADSILHYYVYLWATTWRNQQTECAPSEDSDQPGHPPSLIKVFAVRIQKAWVLSFPLSAQRRLWSDWADAQADLSLRWAHSHFVGFVMSRLILCLQYMLYGQAVHFTLCPSCYITC